MMTPFPMLDRSLHAADHIESRLEFETLISDTSASLVAASPEQVDHVIETALERVRRFFRADRCGLLVVGAGGREVHVQHASYADGVTQVPPHTDLVTVFPWAARRLLVEHLPLRISRMSDLPPEAEADLPAWRHLGIRSALTLPIETGSDVRHMIVIQTVHQECDWPDALVRRLRVLGELFVGCLERREMLSGLRLAEARVSLAADSAEAGLWTLDPRSGLFWLTERARTIYGYSPEEVVTVERLEASVHPDDRDRVRAAIDRALREPGPASVEYRIVAADGRERWIHSRGRAQPGPGGEAQRLMGVSIDVTARRLAEEERRRTQARLTVGAELAGLGFYETDYARGVAYIDDRLLDMLGIPPERSQGRGERRNA
jgi:PAS domain S-box-containing protein